MDVADTDARASSEAPSESSDFYSVEPAPLAGANPAQVVVEENATRPGANAVTDHDGITDQGGDDHDDDYDESSSDDMDLSEPSQPPTPTHHDASSTTAIAGAKRKLSEAEENTEGVAADAVDDQVKKRKVEGAQNPRLSPAIWQRIFTLLPPAMLCRCLRVCKNFNHYLTGMKAPHGQQKDKSTARIVDSEAIWIHSRKTFFPQLPRPLRQHTELEMLQLVGGQTCQFCGKTPVPPPATSVFNCGPGIDGVRVIFPFGVRSCGPCIEPLLQKDVKLLAEPTSARLRLGIAHAFRNEEFHYITETVRQTPPGIPGHLRFSKVYYQPHLAAIKQEEDEAQQLGEGAADEWRKGLYNKGKDAMADSARWEKWETQIRLGANLTQVLREYDLSSYPRRVQEVQSRSTGVNAAQSSTTTNGPHPLPLPVHVFHNGYPPPFPQYPQLGRAPLPQQHQLPPFPPPQLHHQLPFPPQQQQQQQQQHYHHNQNNQHKSVRNAQEVESARQARKAEIERRCQELEPPVEPNVLQHMESFQAAMQITTPLTDAAWDILKPRILSQREAAELTEHARASQLAALQAAMPSFLSEDIISKPAKEIYDREYEEMQMPLRKRLAEYADDIINGHWGGGKMLGKDNVPIFAIQVLSHVRQRYTEDKELGLLDDREPATRRAGLKQGSPPSAPFLSLDNMKWVYDSKVRSFTDVHRKEHFICAGCDEERKPKWFAFEGLIQHYGAKHTTSFSKGNIIVHWQTAEWPETPPFHKNPAHWLKLDRRTSDFRREHRSKGMPQNNHDGPSLAYAATLPVQNARGSLHSTVYHDSVSSYPQYGQIDSQGPLYGDSTVIGQRNGTATNAGHEALLLQLATDSRDIWDALDGVPDMLECVKVQTVLHHAVAKFIEHYNYKPTLDLLTDALAAHNSMRPLKNVTGLACKSCVAAGQNSYSTSYWTRIRGAKSLNMSSLITHFKLMHQPHEHVGPLDWVKDMIELPEKQSVRQLLHTPGMDDNKLALVATAFPNVFPTPLPAIGRIAADKQRQSTSEAPVPSLLGRLGKKQKGNAKKKGQKPANGVQDRDSSHEPLPEPKEDEYDPSRPALVETQSYDPAQFDTDARKPAVSAATVAQPSLGMKLNPDTVAMLHNLAQFSQNASVPAEHRVSRSPSVGRAEHASVAKPSRPSPSAAPNGQPDIGAILAALTGQGQAATPPTSASNNSGSVPRQSHVDAFGQDFHEARSDLENSHHGTRSRHNGALLSPSQLAIGPGTRETQAVSSRNSRQFEHSQHPSYTDRTYSTGPHPQPQAPPQYQYLYESDRPYSQFSPHTPAYREAPLPQYVQIPGRDYAPHGYQYEPPSPKPIYVDQYGRPLIPIDAAPAPVQYVPNLYEQQQYGRQQDQPIYNSVALPPHLQPVYTDRRPIYYEQPASDMPARYTYEERASVGRS